MVTPTNPIDDGGNIAPVDLSTFSMEASGASRSQEADAIAGLSGNAKSNSGHPSVDTLGEVTKLKSARGVLTDLLDKISSFFGGKSNSVQGSTSTGGTTGAGGATTTSAFDEAKKQVDAAKTALQSATTANDYKTAWQSLLDGIVKMSSSATTAEQKAQVQQINTELQSKKPITDNINKLIGLLEQNQQLAESLKTVSSSEQLVGAMGLAQSNQEEAKKILEELKKAGVTSSTLPVLGNIETEMPKSVKTVVDLATALQAAYDAGNQSTAAVEQAQANNSPANIDACNKIIQDAEAALAAAKELAPNSPIVAAAQAQIDKAKADMANIQPSGGGTTNVAGSPGGAATVGTSQNTGATMGEKRVSMLLNDADNQTVSIMLDGLRNMLHLFQEGDSPAASLEKILSDLKGSGGTSTPQGAEALQTIEQELQAAQQGTSGQEALAKALGAIAQAAATAAGAIPTTATKIGGNVKQLYNAGLGSPKSSSYSKALSAGYSAYQSINDAYANSNARVRDVIDNSVSPALSQRVSSRPTESRKDESFDQSVARSIVNSSQTLGDVYNSLSILQIALGIAQKDLSNFNPDAFKNALTEAVTRAPQFGYPHVQLSNDSGRKFMDKLEEQFRENSRVQAETKARIFEKQPEFIQQVLVNISSLFAAYLQ
ncbi:hypothetical protein CP10139811_0758 [Chlamydia ibidis]|uniref:Uncharacterized protein n=2 Tax=Chlamydia ibidis TaxID=1405396 RepID=S7J2T8_9CHLA|nr:hypothetical protein [Chlamydia ibidis]EPP34558.1 hypothetical protein CP10139811_0758 [Chlamydia ibidis]EQM62824.1 hypothetical protein H359_0078 [Chlamydia ibidis 10-1398/6]